MAGVAAAVDGHTQLDAAAAAAACALAITAAEAPSLLLAEVPTAGQAEPGWLLLAEAEAEAVAGAAIEPAVSAMIKAAVTAVVVNAAAVWGAEGPDAPLDMAAASASAAVGCEPSLCQQCSEPVPTADPGANNNTAAAATEPETDAADKGRCWC